MCFVQSMFRSHIALLSTATLLLFNAASVQAAPEDEFIRVRTEISVPDTGPDVQREALASAERAVLRQVLESAVGPAAMAHVASLADETAFFLTSTRVTHYDTDGAHATVGIETFVRVRELRKRAVKELARALPWPPKVMVLAAERMGAEAAYTAAPDSAADRALAEMIAGMRFELARADSLRRRCSDAELAERIRGDLAEIRRFAQENLVDIVVLADAATESAPSDRGANVFKNKAVVTLRVVRARDGKLLEAATREAAVYSAVPFDGAGQAIRDVYARLRDMVHESIVIAAFDPAVESDLIITILAPGNAERFAAITDAIREAAGVEEIDEMYRTDVEALVRILYDGPMARLVDGITLREYQGFSVEAQRVVGRDMTLKVTGFPSQE